MSGKYVLAIDYASDGWQLEEYATKEALEKYLLGGNIYGNSIKVFRELEIKIIDNDVK